MVDLSDEEHASWREQIQEVLEDESDSSDPDFESLVEDESESSESESDAEGDEELMERFELEIEDYVAQFRDELPMRHNEYPGSDSDSEDVEVVPANRRHQIRRRGDGTLHYQQVFYSGVAFKEAVLDYALKSGRNIRQYRWDQMRLGYKCAMAGCNWRIYCSLSRKRNRWEVTVYKNQHACSRNGECLMLTDPVIARLFLDKIRQDPELMMPMKIQEMIKDQWKITATRNQCQEARKKALRWIKKEHEDQFAHIRGYCKEIVTSNPESTVEVETVLGPDGIDLFDRFYVCFIILKRQWKATCRPIIGVDGTFLRGVMKGQLLVAIGRDACNKIYPIAWAVVQVENEKNWLWFVNLLKTDLDLKNGDGCILVSDRQKVCCFNWISVM